MPAEDASEEYVSIGLAGRMLHVSPRTIARWADQGKLPCVVTLGGHRRFRLADLKTAARHMATAAPRRRKPSE